MAIEAVSRRAGGVAAARDRRSAAAGRRRHAVQALFAGLFLACFALAAAGAPVWFPVDLFFLADPLLAGAAALVAREVLVVPLLAGAGVLAATALLGRVFCGYVCPLGACQDWTAPAARSRKARIRRLALATASGRWRWVGRALLAAVVGAALVGIPAAWLLDPLALLWRALALAVYPLALAASALGADAARSALEAFLPTTPTALVVPHRAFAGAALSLGLLALVLALNRVAPRLWCRVACPLGALLSLAAAAPWLRRRVAPEGCVACTRCAAACPAGNLVDDPLRVAPADCLLCLRCADACPTGAVSAGLGGWAAVPAPPPPRPATALDRRRFLGGAAFGFTGLVAADRLPWRTGGAAAAPPLRPPGSRPEAEFLDRCLRCGTCMQACPTNVVQPDVAPGSLGGFFAPTLVLRRGGCDPECTRCGEVCPSGALEALSPEAKRRWVLGTAVVAAEPCLRARGEDCRACREACPWEAVELTRGGARVLAERCTGCGLCELRCPVPGKRPAIRVYTAVEAARLAPPEPARDDSHLPLFLRPS